MQQACQLDVFTTDLWQACQHDVFTIDLQHACQQDVFTPTYDQDCLLYLQQMLAPTSFAPLEFFLSQFHPIP